MSYDMSVKNENWDAQIETCTAGICLGGNHRDFTMLQGEEGWILSDGFQRPKSFNDRTLYSLFHTTCIMMMYQMISEANEDVRKGV